jgi:hypothetical protein
VRAPARGNCLGAVKNQDGPICHRQVSPYQTCAAESSAINTTVMVSGQPKKQWSGQEFFEFVTPARAANWGLMSKRISSRYARVGVSRGAS